MKLCAHAMCRRCSDVQCCRGSSIWGSGACMKRDREVRLGRLPSTCEQGEKTRQYMLCQRQYRQYSQTNGSRLASKEPAVPGSTSSTCVTWQYRQYAQMDDNSLACKQWLTPPWPPARFSAWAPVACAASQQCQCRKTSQSTLLPAKKPTRTQSHTTGVMLL